MKHGVIETTFLKFIQKIEKTGICTLKDIVELIKILQKYESDCHIAIVGQNGIGKSHILLMLLKEFGVNLTQNMFLSDKTSNDVINFLLTHQETALGIDELSLYFGYKEHSSAEQVHLIKMIELARSKRIAIIGCARDPRKLTYNYRNGKLSVVIWIPDRFIEGGSYAAVFVANPVIESEDRFGFGYLKGGISSFDEMRTIFEYIPSFRGYLKVPNTADVISKEELDSYTRFKNTAMAWAQINWLIKRVRKRAISEEELAQHIQVLSSVIPKDEILKLMPKQSKIGDFAVS